MDNTDEIASARQDALAMLGRTELSRRRLVDKMLRKGHKQEVVTIVVNAMNEKGLQSDRRCAEVLTREHARRGHGPERIRHDLCERGLDDDLITEFLQSEEHDFMQLARETREKRYGTDRPVDWAQREKQRAFLYRRGFTGEQIRAAMPAGKARE